MTLNELYDELFRLQNEKEQVEYQLKKAAAKRKQLTIKIEQIKTEIERISS